MNPLKTKSSVLLATIEQSIESISFSLFLNIYSKRKDNWKKNKPKFLKKINKRVKWMADYLSYKQEDIKQKQTKIGFDFSRHFLNMIFFYFYLQFVSWFNVLLFKWEWDVLYAKQLFDRWYIGTMYVHRTVT